MKFLKSCPLPLAGLLLASALFGFGEEDTYVTLKNTEGVEIEAKLLDLRFGIVDLERKGYTQIFRVPMENLSAPSQKLVKDWQIAQAVKNLRFGFAERTIERDNGSSESRSWETRQEGLSIRVANESSVAIKGITVKFLVLYRDENIGDMDRRNLPLREFKGDLRFPEIPAGDTVRLETAAIPLRKEWMNPNWSYATGEQSAEDEIEGVVVEFYHEGKLIHEEASPSKLLEDYSATGKRSESKSAKI